MMNKKQPITPPAQYVFKPFVALYNTSSVKQNCTEILTIT